MSHSSESNRTLSTKRVLKNFNGISEHISHLAEELEIENVYGLDGNEMEIIALIRNCPLLYDKSFPDYNDEKKKEQAWKAIAKIFNVSSADLQQFWYRLKQTFFKFSTKNIDVNSTTSLTSPSHLYFDEMQFLKAKNVKSSNISSNLVIHEKENSSTNASSEQENPVTNNVFNEMKLDILIELVRENPILYDRKHEDAKNHVLKLRTWKKLAKEIGIPVSECVNRWKILRERYGRERKYRKTHPEGRKWYLYDKLSFLEGHVFKKRYSHAQIPGKISKGFFNNEVTHSLGDDVYSSAKLFSNRSQSQAIDFGESLSNDGYDTIMEKLTSRQYFEEENDNFATYVIKESLQDEDELFALTIAAELKKISNSRRKTRLKADIYNLLLESTNQR